MSKVSLPVCVVCGHEKVPSGVEHQVKITVFCNQTCPGYSSDPKPGRLWPDEEKESNE